LRCDINFNAVYVVKEGYPMAAATGSSPLVTIQGIEPEKQWVPSRFNARATTEDGTLILYNSYLGTYSCFPQAMREEVLSKLSKKGFTARQEGLTKYLYERGYLVPRGADELRRMRHLYGQIQYRQDTLELILLSSEECNFRCVYCYETFPRETMEPWVRQGIIKLVERRVAAQTKRLHLSWFGGEPLLGYEAIQEIGPAVTEIAEKNGVRFNADMTTNGYLLTPERFEELIRWKVNSYQISVDGAAAQHDAHRILRGGGGTYETIMENLRSMQKTSHNFVVAVRVNFDPETRNQMADFMKELEAFKSDPRFVLRFYPIGKWGGPQDDKLNVCGTNQEEEREHLLDMAEKEGFHVETRKETLRGAQSGSSVCYAARPYNYIIGADGRLMKCTIALNNADYNIVGTLGQDGNLAVDIDKLTRWTAPYFEDDASCRKCFYLPVCQGCTCPLEIIVSNHRPCPPDKSRIQKTLQSIWRSHKNTANQYNLNTRQLSK
jgi:uncharacterized protein